MALLPISSNWEVDFESSLLSQVDLEFTHAMVKFGENPN